MTQQEVITEIISEPKWYIGKYKQQNASAIIRRFKKGDLKYKTLIILFRKMGYEGEHNNWTKTIK